MKFELKNLKEISKIIMGQSPPSSSYNILKKGVPFLQGNAEFGLKYPHNIYYTTNPLKVVPKESLLISVRAPVGETNLADKEYCIGRGLAAIIPQKEKVDLIYLFYFFKRIQKKLLRVAGGSTFLSITKGDLENLPIPLPPLSEQRKIAEILSTVDEAIEVTDKEIEKAERLKRGLMQDLLTKGIGHTRFKKTELGTIPEEWKVVRLKFVIYKIENGIWGETPIENEKCYPVIRSTEITHDGKIDLSSVAYRKIPEDKVENYRLRRGDILIVSSSGSSHLLGRSAIFEDEQLCLFSNFMFRLRPKGILPRFLFYTLNSMNYFSYLRRLQQTSTGLRNLAKRDLLNFKLSLPPLSEQEKIAEILSAVDDFIESLRARREKLVKLKQGLMEDLLTGKRRVKIDAEKP